MIPTFNLYLSILSGSWHPSLAPNRATARFDALLQAVHYDEGCSCSFFFRQLACHSGGPPCIARHELHNEALQLATLCGCGDSNEFINLPAAGSRERFYNLLTGYCLSSYEQWIIQTLRDHHTGETGRWIRYRLVERLHALLTMPVAGADIPPRQLLIVCRTLAAIAILMYRMTAGSNGYPSLPQPREELKTALAACNLALPARRQVLSLFDRATGCPHLPAPHNGTATPATAVANDSPPPQLPGGHPLNRLMEACQKDSKPLRQQILELLDKQKKQPPAAGSDPDERIDSARACEILGISRKTLHRLRRKNKIAFINVGGKYFYRLADIMQLVSEQSNREKPGTGKERPGK